MKVDRAPCWHCRRMFEPWSNERYCSTTCHDAAQKARMNPMATHTVLTVSVADHEANDPQWRVQHAAETIGIVAAYFTSGPDGTPVQADDGTFEVHAPSRTTLGTLRDMLEQHEGMTIVSEQEAPGTGVLATRPPRWS